MPVRKLAQCLHLPALLCNTLAPSPPLLSPFANVEQVCPTVRKNIFNRDSCVRREACAMPLYPDTTIHLNEAALR